MAGGSHEAVGVAKPLGPLVVRHEPSPTAGPRQLVAKLLKLGFTPLSLWQVDFGLLVPDDGMILGGNFVGEVVQVGEELEREGRVKPGDKVMAFQFGASPGKPAQELVLIDEHDFCKVPANITDEEAATIPDSFVTAYHSMATELGVPLPTSFPSATAPTNPELPILIWGGGTTCGQFTVQLLKASGYTNITVTASAAHTEKLKSFGAREVHSYSAPLPSSVQPFEFVLDCVGDLEHSVKPISQAPLSASARVAVLLPVRLGGYGSTTGVEMDISVQFPAGVEVKGVRTHFYKANPVLAEHLQPTIMFDLFSNGIVKPTAYRAVKGDTFLERCQNALSEVREGKVRGEKLIC